MKIIWVLGVVIVIGYAADALKSSDMLHLLQNRKPLNKKRQISRRQKGILTPTRERRRLV